MVTTCCVQDPIIWPAKRLACEGIIHARLWPVLCGGFALDWIGIEYFLERHQRDYFNGTLIREYNFKNLLSVMPEPYLLCVKGLTSCNR